MLDLEIIEKLRDICYRNRMSLSDAVTESLQHMFRMDSMMHGPCDAREKNLKAGRKIKI